jgi:AraC-like DNA-binding protein
MLRWAGEIGLGGGSQRYALGLSPGLRLYAMTRHAMIYDSSFDVADPGPPSPNLTLYALLAGDLWLRAPDEHITAPALLLMPQRLVDGANGRRTRHYVNAGSPLRVCQVAFAPSVWRGEPHSGDPDHVQRVDVDPALFARLGAAVERFQDDAPSASRAAAIEIIERLIEANLLAGQSHPLHSTGWGPGVDRIWSAFSRVLTMSPLPSLTDLGDAASRSPRQLQRDLLQFAGTMALSSSVRWRTTMLHWRLKLAMALLSAPTSSPPTVARTLGYGSSDALTRAFLQAGLGRPAEVREALRAIAADPPGTPRVQ